MERDAAFATSLRIKIAGRLLFRKAQILEGFLQKHHAYVSPVFSSNEIRATLFLPSKLHSDLRMLEIAA
jgi:hypothetical protein